MIGAVDIMGAMSTREGAYGATLDPVATSFQYFPDEDQHAVTKFPYFGHQVEASGARTISINHLGSVEDEQWHRIWVYIMFAREEDPLDIVSRLDAEWRDRYRPFFLMNLRWGIQANGTYGITESVMGDILPAGLDLFNRKDVGIMVPVTVTVRQPMQTSD